MKYPTGLYDKFSETPALFVVQEIPDRCTLEVMKIYKEKTGRKTVREIQKLLDLMRGKKISLHTPCIKWYLPHSRRLAEVYYLVEYEPGKPT